MLLQLQKNFFYFIFSKKQTPSKSRVFRLFTAFSIAQAFLGLYMPYVFYKKIRPLKKMLLQLHKFFLPVFGCFSAGSGFFCKKQALYWL
jgi:hypothetical protein